MARINTGNVFRTAIPHVAIEEENYLGLMTNNLEHFNTLEFRDLSVDSSWSRISKFH